MKLSVVKNEKNLIEFYVEGERYTFPNLLKTKLLGDKNVEFVSFLLDHPTDNRSHFVLRTSSKTPSKALAEACGEIEKDLDDFEKGFKKAMK
ncbi:MAG: DNA-directed RNA polymerase subunit L [Candidatus Diapherotrites archaeon]